MEQGINLTFVMARRNGQPSRSLQEALTLCRDAGFTVLDYAAPVGEDNYLDLAKRTRAEIERFGLRVEQTHSCCFRYRKDVPPGELFRKYVPRSVEAAAALGAKYVVIHADEFRSDGPYDEAELLKFTYDYLAPSVERCVDLGVRPAFEILTGPNGGNPDQYCCTVPQLLNIISMFPGSGAGCCWDFGHAQVALKDDALAGFEAIQPYLLCMHVHDNSWGKDMHKPAFFGSIDWYAVMKILKQNGYSGAFSWEFVYERFPDELYPDYLRFVHRIGEYLLSLLKKED